MEDLLNELGKSLGERVSNEGPFDGRRISKLDPIIDLVRQNLPEDLQRFLYRTLYDLCSEANLALTIDSDLLAILLSKHDGESTPELLRLIKRLITVGISPGLTKWLFRQLLKSDTTSTLYEIVLHAIDHTLPPHFHFDTTQHGFASIEFPSLPRVFPPTQGGYSLFTWIYIEKTDKDMHITLFGVFDPSQKSFTMAYIEKSTNCLILQTSLRTSVRFKYPFETGQWYNVALIHRRPRTTTSSRASLFVNARLIETLKIAYPANCPQSSSMQGFLGTLKDFTPPGASHVAYSMGHTILVGQVLLPELIEQYHKLGPEYVGNYQDYLASYMTYRASSEMKVLLEQPEATVLSAKNSENMPEASLVLSISGETFSTTDLSLATSREARSYLNGLAKANIPSIVLNKAIPGISTALASGAAVGHIGGGVTGLRPNPLVSNVYKIGGVGVFLYLIEAAQTKEQVLLGVRICLKAVSTSFINSEDFEKTHAYEMLAKILREKHSEFICDELLGILLEFIGIGDAFLTNPLAYRYLLADFSLWSKASESVQRSHLDQFLIFSNSPQYESFNNGRLARMHIIKKFLAVLRSGVSTTMLPYFMEALKGLLSRNFSTESIRIVSSFIIHMLHSKGQRRRLSILVHTRDTEKISSMNSRQDIGVAVLTVVEEILCEPDAPAAAFLDKFAYTITNRWSLLLLSNCHTRPIAIRILARLLVIQGRSYVSKFAGKNDGFVICEALLEKAKDNLWISLFAILFGQDIARLPKDTEQIDLAVFLRSDLSPDKVFTVVVPEIFAVILATIRRRALYIARLENSTMKSSTDSFSSVTTTEQRAHARSHSLDTVMGEALKAEHPSPEQIAADVNVLRSVVAFMSAVSAVSASFRTFLSSANIVSELFRIVFFLVCDAEEVPPEAELYSKDSVLTFDKDVTSVSLTGTQGFLKVKGSAPITAVRAPSLQRGSSYVLLGSLTLEPDDADTCSDTTPDPVQGRELSSISSLTEDFLQLLVHVVAEDVMAPNELALPERKCLPPAFVEHQTFFWSSYGQALVKRIVHILSADPSKLTVVRTLSNFAMLGRTLYTNIEDGSFLQGSECLFELLAFALEYIRTPEIAALKTVRICDTAVVNIRQTLEKLVLSRLSDLSLDVSTHTDSPYLQSSGILNRLLYYQQLLFHPDMDTYFLRLLLYHLYKLTTKEFPFRLRLLALDVWRSIVLSQNHRIVRLLQEASEQRIRIYADEWAELLAIDSETFLNWLDEHRSTLDMFFITELGQDWATFVQAENKENVDRNNDTQRKRREQLKIQSVKTLRIRETIAKYEQSSSSWYDNVVKVEASKNRKAHQDLADNQIYISSKWISLTRELTRSCAVFQKHTNSLWQLDPTECALRQRKKMRPNFEPVVVLARGETPKTQADQTIDHTDSINASVQEQDYELIEPQSQSRLPSVVDEKDEDRNRKVLRSLDVDDSVDEVYNISRISGLNAIEGLLILGRLKLYIIDNYFNRSDGEICEVSDESVRGERDPILQVLSGQKSSSKVDSKSTTEANSHACRSFSYEMVLSTSKRQFLFRDVALELFFSDGRNYLITTLNKERDTIHRKILERTRVNHTDELARKDTVGAIGTFGSKFLNVFTNSPAARAASRWEKREISNFEYLMILNGLAGRSYNDLTQYPIMPWILADYTSETLDLTNPSTFRDLSKNMGSQSSDRQRDFQERYESFAQAGIDETKPFHFGTHYSSAMIVCSYLIRLVPFVESYLLLQGGHFDHPDRLFYSVEKAWLSASRDNMTDVRELTPEWFFLPEFLTNDNHFDFGLRQVTAEKINHVELPPWAHGNPQVFIQKHREALECQYVSEHLHEWIDLIFGYKQLGQAAVEATNVYHALSYHGAIDLDIVKDPVERLATIGIIHNFGQTPRQVFSKPHNPRNAKMKANLLESVLPVLSLQPGGLDIRQAVGQIQLRDGLVGLPIGRVKLSAGSDVSVHWATSDHSIRVLSLEGHLLGIYPSLHTQPVTHCLAVSNALILGSEDTTVSVLKLSLERSSHLIPQSQAYLRGHSSKITALTVSSAYSIIVSGEHNGSVIVFDLNRLEFVRLLCNFEAPVTAISVNDITGDILACSNTLLKVFTVNGCLLAETSISAEMGNIVSASSFSNDVFFTGHCAVGAVIWNLGLSDDYHVSNRNELHWKLTQTKQLAYPGPGSIICFKTTPTRLYTGDTKGKVCIWGV